VVCSDSMCSCTQWHMAPCLWYTLWEACVTLCSSSTPLRTQVGGERGVSAAQRLYLPNRLAVVC
jgi:hypothetical protein